MLPLQRWWFRGLHNQMHEQWAFHESVFARFVKNPVMPVVTFECKQLAIETGNGDQEHEQQGIVGGWLCSTSYLQLSEQRHQGALPSNNLCFNSFAVPNKITARLLKCITQRVDPERLRIYKRLEWQWGVKANENVGPLCFHRLPKLMQKCWSFMFSQIVETLMQ